MKAASWLALCGVLGAVIGWQGCQINRLGAEFVGATLARDSALAAADSTRAVSARAARLLGDSLRAVERRVIQVRQERDAFDRALRRERLALGTIRVTLDSFRTTASAPVSTPLPDTTVRVATFEVDSTAYHLTARAELPPAPRAGTLHATVRLQPVPVELRLGCGAAVRGIRPAFVTATVPPWARVELGPFTQDPELCRSPALQVPTRRGRWLAVGVLLGWLAGRL